ncbi:MAG: class IV adenylate cyclase [Ginsengibacter sp.]
MSHINFEFKAQSGNIDFLEKKLLELHPKFIGEDHQIDTYFNVQKGRLKLREGNIENSLIYYERKDSAGAKQSDVLLYQHSAETSLKDILIKVHGVLVVVDKVRRIYFIDNVKFHFDRVVGLGTFVEVEAIDLNGGIGIEKLKNQCAEYAKLFGIKESDYISHSYSDLILESQI